MYTQEFADEKLDQHPHIFDRVEDSWQDWDTGLFIYALDRGDVAVILKSGSILVCPDEMDFQLFI